MSEVSFLEPLVQYGLLGVVLAWFMWRNEKVITRLTESQEKLTAAIVQACEDIKK